MDHQSRLMELRDELGSGGELTLLGLGDSLTDGWEVERGFYDRFVLASRERFPSATIRSINAGVPGDTARGGLSRLLHLVDRRPDLAVVQFGLNDAFMGVSTVAYAESLRSIGHRLGEAGCVAALVTSCPVEGSEAMTERYYSALVDVALAEGFVFVELHRYWLSHPQRAASRLIGPDGVHPTDAGHALMAEGLLAALWT